MARSSKRSKKNGHIENTAILNGVVYVPHFIQDNPDIQQDLFHPIPLLFLIFPLWPNTLSPRRL